jgi:hypothetical protein
MDKKDNKLVFYGAEARGYLIDGARELYEAVTTTYRKDLWPSYAYS